MPISGGTHGYQFKGYTYTATTASGVHFTPPIKTIIMVTWMAATQKLSILGGFPSLETIKKHDESLGANEVGYFGAIYCDGTKVHFKNEHIASQDIELRGLKMA